jgi:hypothetical protein
MSLNCLSVVCCRALDSLIPDLLGVKRQASGSSQNEEYKTHLSQIVNMHRHCSTYSATPRPPCEGTRKLPPGLLTYKYIVVIYTCDGRF